MVEIWLQFQSSLEWCLNVVKSNNYVVAKGFSVVRHFGNQAATFELIMEDCCPSLLDSVLITFLRPGSEFHTTGRMILGGCWEKCFILQLSVNLVFKTVCCHCTFTRQLTTDESPSLVSWLQMSHQTALLEESSTKRWSAHGLLTKTKLWWKFRRTLWPAHLCNTPHYADAGFNRFLQIQQGYRLPTWTSHLWILITFSLERSEKHCGYWKVHMEDLTGWVWRGRAPGFAHQRSRPLQSQFRDRWGF